MAPESNHLIFCKPAVLKLQWVRGLIGTVNGLFSQDYLPEIHVHVSRQNNSWPIRKSANLRYLAIIDCLRLLIFESVPSEDDKSLPKIFNTVNRSLHARITNFCPTPKRLLLVMRPRCFRRDTYISG